MTDITNYIKLAQFEAAILEKRYKKNINIHIQRLINKGFDVNYRLTPINSFNFQSNYLGGTALHLAFIHDELDIFRILLNAGADFTLKNNEEKTVIHLALDRSFCRKKACWALHGELQHPYIDAVLEKQISSKVIANPYSKDGLSHFHAACITNNIKAVLFFLKNGKAVNKAIDKSSKILPGYTPLHLAVRYCALDVIKLLLDYHVDVHLKNAEGMNAFVMLIKDCLQIRTWLNMDNRAIYCKELTNLLAKMESAIQLIFNWTSTLYNRLRRIDDIGFSCLHAACFLKDSSTLKTIINKGYNKAHIIRVDSPIWPGYTALHFAVQHSFDIAIYLLEQGFDILAKDTKGVTPFDLAIEVYEPKMIYTMILNQAAWKNLTFSDNKTKLTDFILAMDTEIKFKSFLNNINAGINIHLPADSPIWSGFTPLHLAVIFFKGEKDINDLQIDVEHKNDYDPCIEENQLYFKRIQICLNLGADITIKNAQGLTALQLALERQMSNIIELMLKWNLNLLKSVDEKVVSHFHIACIARNKFMVEKFLLEGADVNSHLPVRVPYQRIYQAEERQTVSRFLKSITISCEKKKLDIFYISAGSTSLHIAVAAQCPEMMDMLLKYGADIYATDDNGFTPLHRMLTVEDPQKFINCLELLENMRDCTHEHGLSHLHIACLVGSESCARRLLQDGANVEAVLTYKDAKFQTLKKFSARNLEFVDPYDDPAAEPMSFLVSYLGYRPLHFAIRSNNPMIVKLLLEYNADILSKSVKGWTALYSAFTDEDNSCQRLLIEALKNNAVLRKRMKEETGLTILHFFCFLLDVEAVSNELSKKVDVNAQACEDSLLWAGCTPLHVLMRASHNNGDDSVRIITHLMLARGADVTIVNVDNKSPIHVIQSRDCCQNGLEVRSHSYIVDMLEAQANFSINPVSCNKISHFHIACMWDIKKAVQKFLENGIDPNYRVEYFKSALINSREETNINFPGGSTPLQLAVIHNSKNVFNFLLNPDLRLDVDLQAEDYLGRTVLHVAADYLWNDTTYFQEIFKRNVDINAEDIFGRTAFERILTRNEISDEITKIFLKRGCSINAYNSVTKEGYVAFCIQNPADMDKPRAILEFLMGTPSVLEINDRGQNVIHNAMSLNKLYPITVSNYFTVIDRFKQLGCDIDLQDCSGKTPLHVAMQFQNFEGILALLESSANISILDNDNKSAFAYTREWTKNNYNDKIIKLFLLLIYQCQLCDLHLNEIDKNIYLEYMKDHEHKSSLREGNNILPRSGERSIDQCSQYQRQSCPASYHNEINNEIYVKCTTGQQFQFPFKQCHLNELVRLKKQSFGNYLLTVHDFLSETGAVAAYPYMTAGQREAVDKFFQSERTNLRKNFEMFSSLLILQYGKACKREELLVKATSSFNILVGFEWPYLCSKSIFRFLSNAELGNLITSTSLDFISCDNFNLRSRLSIA